MAIIKVRSLDDGKIGWAATYGTPGFGGVRTSVFATRAAAKQADVSDDVGPHVLHRCCDLLRHWERAE